MANSQYDYDNDGETWPFFIISVLSMILIPLTITTIGKLFQRNNNANIKGALECDFESEISSSIRSFKLKHKSSQILNLRFVFIVFGWAVLIYLSLNTKTSSFQVAFDPYTILDISMSASEKEVKSRYRKLSLIYHPDKIASDVSETEKKVLEETFIKINQAYKALTDEVTKKNFELYGHPDGPQEVSRGIALPKFLVEGKYSGLVVVFYFLLIGVLLPLIVGSWWSRAKTYTKKGIHVKTAATFVKKLINSNPAKVVTPLTILDWLVESEELNLSFPKETPESLKELVLQYLNRDFKSQTNEKLAVVTILPHLISGLIDIAGSFRNTDIVLNANELRRCIIQAVNPIGKKQQLDQLPNVDREAIKASSVKTLGKLLSLPKSEIKTALGISDEKKLDSALQVASQIPILTVHSAEFKVPGESVVPPSSLSHISIKVSVGGALLKAKDNVAKEKLIEEETMESLRNPFKIDEDQPELPVSFTPYFPSEVSGSWIALLILQRDGKLAETPTYFQRLDLSNLELNKDEFVNGEKVKVGTFKLKLESPSPPAVGKFAFRVVLKHTSYFGSDYDIPVTLDVQEPPQIEDINDDPYDISDPEEDSIAGAFAQMKGENVKRESNDDESDSEYSDEEVFTDINTDTEDEAEDEKTK